MKLMQRASTNTANSTRIKACTHIYSPLYYCTLSFNDNPEIYGMVFHSNLSPSNKSYCDCQASGSCDSSSFFLLPSNSIRLLSEKLAKAFSVVVEMGRR